MRSPNRRVALGAAVAGALLVGTLVSPRTVLGPVERLADDPLLFGCAVLALYLVRPLLAWPPTLCAAVVGYGYGVEGVPLALAGAALTALGPFYATRWAAADPPGGDPGGSRLREWLTDGADSARTAGERYFSAAGGVRGMTAARLAPIPADLTTCAAAVSGVSVPTLIAGTLIGEVPWTVAAVLVGASAGRIAGGIGEVGLPLALASAGGALLLLAGPLYRALESGESGVGG